MRRKFATFLFIVFILQLIFYMPIYKVKAELNNSPYKYDKKGYFYVDENSLNNDLENVNLTSEVNTNASITFVIDDPEHVMWIDEDIRAFYRSYYDSGRNYNYIQYWQLNKQITQTETGWEIRLYNLDWENVSFYYVNIRTSMYLFNFKITNNDVGKTIKISADDTYFEPVVNIEGVSELELNGINLSYNDENGKPIYAGFWLPGIKISAKKYNVQILAYSENDGFFINKNNVELSNTNNIININNGEIAKLIVKTNDSNNLNLIPRYFRVSNNFYSTYGLNLNYKGKTYDSVYVSKNSSLDVSLSATTQDNWWLEYRTTLIASDNENYFNIGAQFSTQISIQFGRIYKPGDYLYNELYISDEFGNKVWINSPYGGDLKGKLEFYKENNEFVISTDARINGYPVAILPDLTGTFNLVFRVEGLPFEVKPSIGKINIGIYSEKPGIPYNFKVFPLTQNSIGLTWSRTERADRYNIYRAESIDGEYSKIASLPERNDMLGNYKNFIDQGLEKNKIYYYKISAENNAGETFTQVLSGSVFNNYDNFITFTINDPNNEQFINLNDIRIIAKTYYSSNGYYYNNYTWDSNVGVIVEKIDSKWKVTISNLDWQKNSEYKILIGTLKYIFIESINKNDINKEISLIPDEGYINPHINISFADNSINLDRISITPIDENGVSMYFDATALPSTLMPSGNYCIKVLAYDNNYAYNLTKQNVNLNYENNIINFDEENVKLIKINLNDSTGQNLLLDYFYTYNNIHSSYPIWINNYNKMYNLIYVSKDDNQFGVGIRNADYSLRIYYRVQSESDTLNLGTQFSAEINLNKTNYETGEYLYNAYFGVKDEFGNRINWIRASNNEAKGLIEIKKDGSTTWNSTLYNISCYPSIQLPSSKGTYELKYSIIDSPISISPAIKSITIDQGSEPANNPSPIFNIKAFTFKDKSIAITWNSTDYSSLFRIYRAENQNGPFTLIGEANTNEFIDRNVDSGKTYWYKITQIKNGIESLPSNIVNAKAEENYNNYVELVLDDENYSQYLMELRVLYKLYFGNEYKYGVLFDKNVLTENNGNEFKITVCNFDWSKADKFYVNFSTNKYVFSKEITRDDLGKTIKLSADETYFIPQININFGGENKRIEGINLNLVDENGVLRNYSGLVQSGVAMPAGKYSIQVLAKDGQNAYFLIKENIDLDKNNNTINFEQDEAGLVNINLNDTANMNARLRYFKVVDPKFDVIPWITLQDKGLTYSSVYITKGLNQNITIETVSGNNYAFDYGITINEVADVQDVYLGTNIYSNIHLIKTVFEPNEILDSNVFTVEDQYENRIMKIIRPDGSSVGTNIEYSQTDIYQGTELTYKLHVNTLNYGYINVPNFSGNLNGYYLLKFTLDDSNIPYSYYSTKIGILDWQEILETVKNLEATPLNSKQIALEWLPLVGADSYNIYRSEAEAGEYVFIGNTQDNVFIDSNLQSEKTYYYKVSGVCERGEGYPSNIVSATTLGSDNTIVLSIDNNFTNELNNAHVTIYYKKIDGNDYTYEKENAVILVDKVNGKLKIYVNSLDWNKSPEYYLVINNEDNVYYSVVKKTDIGNEIVLGNGLVPQVNIAFANQDLNIELINLSLLDSNNKAIYVGRINPNAMIASGKYTLQVIAKDSSNIYYLTKDEIELNQQNNIINFERVDTTELTNYPICKMEENNSNFETNWSVYLNDEENLGKKLFVSKAQWREFNFDEGSISHLIKMNLLEDTKEVNYDYNYYPKLELIKEIYNIGEVLSDELLVTDSYGNIVRGDIPYISAGLELTNERQEVINIPISNVMYPEVMLQYPSGRYTLKFYYETENGKIYSNAGTIVLIEFKYGDLDSDGKVTSLDYLKLKAHILGKILLDQNAIKAADVNGDGIITSIDYALIKRFILGKITKFPVE